MGFWKRLIGNGETQFQKGNEQFEQGQYAEALALYDQGLEIDPYNSRMWTNRGIALRIMERYEDALASYDRALEIDQELAIVWINRGFVLSTLGRHEGALVSFERALEIDPHHIHAWAGRGNVLDEIGRFEDSLASYERVIEIDPHCAIAWKNRGIILRKLGQYAEADASFERAYELDPHTAIEWVDPGSIHQAPGDDNSGDDSNALFPATESLDTTRDTPESYTDVSDDEKDIPISRSSTPGNGHDGAASAAISSPWERADEPNSDYQPSSAVLTIFRNYEEIRNLMNRYLVGKDPLIELITIALLSDGHILIQGVPGTAKTTIAKTYARMLGYTFSRVQCAVDTQPSDILGLRVYDQAKREFSLWKGPIFSNILLIDELNRLNPRTQSAFIEVMSERQVTIEGETHHLPDPFFVMATQNPYEFEGTFPLIEAQKDRFMYSFISDYLSPDDELEVLRRLDSGKLNWDAYAASLDEYAGSFDLLSLRSAVESIHCDDRVAHYIRDLVMATREHGDIALGASTRATIAFYKGSKVVAALHGRDFVVPDDVREIADHILHHRLILRREAEIAGVTIESVINQIIGSVEVP